MVLTGGVKVGAGLSWTLLLRVALVVCLYKLMYLYLYPYLILFLCFPCSTNVARSIQINILCAEPQIRFTDEVALV